jgi:hypothetical protein
MKIPYESMTTTASSINSTIAFSKNLVFYYCPRAKNAYISLSFIDSSINRHLVLRLAISSSLAPWEDGDGDGDSLRVYAVCIYFSSDSRLQHKYLLIRFNSFPCFLDTCTFRRGQNFSIFHEKNVLFNLLSPAEMVLLRPEIYRSNFPEGVTLIYSAPKITQEKNDRHAKMDITDTHILLDTARKINYGNIEGEHSSPRPGRT